MFIYLRSRHPIGGNCPQKKKDKAPVPPAIEEKAGSQHDEFPYQRVRTRQPVQKKDDYEEETKGQGGKKHLFTEWRKGKRYRAR